MHFAMPPRKTSRPPPYAARNKSSMSVPPALRNLLLKDRLRWVVLAVLGFWAILWLRGSSSAKIKQGGGWSDAGIAKVAVGSGPPVVIVTVIDPGQDPAWTERIKKNREDYAKRHGYKTFFPRNDNYPLLSNPVSWARVPAMRHAMTLFPGSTFIWYLDATALIMTPSTAIHTQFLAPARLESIMITDAPVVPPYSVIKTFANLKGDRIDLVATQDAEGLSVSSFVVRNGEWAKFFLDSWFDPIYRSYNFQKAESHALEHIVQWHGTILAKLAIIPQNIVNAYASGPANPEHGKFKPGDLVAVFPGCDRDERSCATEQTEYFDILDKKKGE